MPEAAILTSTSPGGPGGSSSISSTLHSAPISQRIAAVVFMANPLLEHCSTTRRRPAADEADDNR